MLNSPDDTTTSAGARPDMLDDGHRTASLAAMSRGPLDLLVIGGGVTGAGVALDAAARGMRVGLLEQDDLASGTSSRSSKLIHGGIRYLEQGNLRLVREALRERELLLTRIAPHLVHPVPFVLPLRHRVWERAYLGAGVALYDRMGGARSVPAGRHLGRRALQQTAPGLRHDRLRGGIRFWDAQTDDARLVLTLARTAAACGAHIATRTRVRDLLVARGEVCGAGVQDTETGETREIRARHVIMAAGPWSERLLDRDDGEVRLRPSKGVHLLIRRHALDLDQGVISRTRSGLLFIIPWEDDWLVGDTDTEWRGAPDDPLHADRSDVGTILDRLADVVRIPVRPEDVLGVFAGLRPLVAADPAKDTVRLSREHVIASPQPGLTVITGGKLTTYREMAEQVVDAAREAARATAGTSSTADLPLIGAAGYPRLLADRASLAASSGLDVAQVGVLLRRYGDRIEEVLGLVTQDPDLARPVARDVLRAEIIHACTHEGARHLDDVLVRRTRLSIRTPHGGAEIAAPVAALMQRALGWDDDVTAREIQNFLDRSARETAALPAPVGTDSAGDTRP